MSFDELSNLKAILLAELLAFLANDPFCDIIFSFSNFRNKLLKQLKNFVLIEFNLVMMFNIDQYFVFND
jgi:hypothetical protein